MRDQNPDFLTLTALKWASNYLVPAIKSGFRWIVGVLGEIKSPAFAGGGVENLGSAIEPQAPARSKPPARAQLWRDIKAPSMSSAVIENPASFSSFKRCL